MLELAFTKTNRDRWDELTPIHARSVYYDVHGFKAGKSSLRSIEREELTDVEDKSLLHLQCHFGLDTLSWARLGARVTGVDFSEQAIALARSLSRELAAEACFLCSDIYGLPQVLSGKYDIVFASYGVLRWLPDLAGWARVAAHFLKPGGTLYLVDAHPMSWVLEVCQDSKGFDVVYPYFHAPEPRHGEFRGTYADRTANVRHAEFFNWHHGLGQIITALSSAGLRIQFVHEFPYLHVGVLANMEQGADGWWRLKNESNSIPLLFSLKAMKEGD
jgi:SAM-dependent methyltransferase